MELDVKPKRQIYYPLWFHCHTMQSDYIDFNFYQDLRCKLGYFNSNILRDCIEGAIFNAT